MNTALFGVGVVLVILGLIASAYVVTETDEYLFGAFTDTDAERPYAGYAIPLIVVGILLMIVGALIPTETVITKRTTVEPVRKTTTRIREE